MTNLKPYSSVVGMIKTELREKMMDVALEHIYMVNADPNIKLANVDAYDAWIKYDDNWDLNVHEANFGMGEDYPEESDSCVPVVPVKEI